MLLRRPLPPQKTKTGYRVALSFLDAAPPNQLRGLDEKTYHEHALKALEAVLQLVCVGFEASWEEALQIREFEFEWARPNPYLYATEIHFSLYGADEASATLAIKITSRDGTVEIADALCTLSLLKAKTSGNDTASALKKLREQFGLRRETVGGQHRVQA